MRFIRSSPKAPRIIYNKSTPAHIPGSKQTVQDILQSVDTFTGPKAQFVPARLLSDGQLHTIYSSVRFKKHAPKILYKRIHLLMADGGNTTVSLSPPAAFADGGDKSTQPIVVILHGILGSPDEPYITPIVARLTAPREAGGCGVRVAVITLRACGGQRMTSTEIHHPKQTQDLSAVMLWVATKFPFSRRFGIGCSMGANILTNYLGERGEYSGLAGGFALSSVSRLSACFGRLRDGNLIDRLIINRNLGGLYGDIFSKNKDVFSAPFPWIDALAQLSPPPPLGSISTSSSASSLSNGHGSLRSYTTMYTTPTPSVSSAHSKRVAQAAKSIEAELGGLTMTRFSDFVGVCAGFDSTEEFCEETSSEHRITAIRTPFLMLNALDDPMMPGESLPIAAVNSNPHVAMVTTKHGGHLGWVGRKRDSGGRRIQWHVDAVVEWINGLVDAGARSRVDPRPTRGPVAGMTYEEGRPDVGYMEVSKGFIDMIPLKLVLPRHTL